MKALTATILALAVLTTSAAAHPGRWVEGHWYQGHYYEGFYKEHKHHKSKPKPVKPKHKPIELTPEQAFLVILFGLSIFNNGDE